ncbi:MAG: 30S ribosomal protein S2 [Thermoflexales bacterium]|nr:30S ribosomal protein S2 [Thermoflexales bacterium]
MSVIPMKTLLETGVHFGHRTRRWNPKMRSYIFTERNNIHIIDLQQTMRCLEDAYAAVRDKVAEGGTLLFVGTKRQAQETIALQAQRCGMPYVNQRWLGGTLTNWRTIRSRIDTLLSLEQRRAQGEFERLSKKEALMLNRQIDKLNARLGGIKTMLRLPDMVFVVDVCRETTALREANMLEVPVIAIVDTNGDPDTADYVIPANDDAIRAIKILTSAMADAVMEGMAMRKETMPLEEIERAGLGADEQYLGAATLAKLRSGELEFEDEGRDKVEEKTYQAEDVGRVEDEIEDLGQVEDEIEDLGQVEDEDVYEYDAEVEDEDAYAYEDEDEKEA